MKMKTGVIHKNIVPNTFYITMIALNGILKRASFKDMALFKSHNPIYISNPTLFTTAVCFNLFSSYGIGNKIKPLLQELIINDCIAIENHLSNVYYQEVIHLAPIITAILYEGDIHKEVMWSYDYAIQSLNKTDALSTERFTRLHDLFISNSDVEMNESNEVNEMDVSNNSNEIIGSNESNNSNEMIESNEMNEMIESNGSNNSIEIESDEMIESDEFNNNITNENIIEIELCFCNFCIEFRKYYQKREQSPDEIILEVLKEIGNEVMDTLS